MALTLDTTSYPWDDAGMNATRIGTPDDRFRESATRLPDPIVIGSDYSKHPIPGQQGLVLASAGYREAYGTPVSHCPLGTEGCTSTGCSPAPGRSCTGPHAPRHVDMGA